MSISVDRENNFRTNSISGLSSGNEIIIEKFGGSNSNSSISPSASSGPKLFSNMLAERKTKMIPPQLSSKRVPIDSFGGLANSKKTSSDSISSQSSLGSSNIDDSDDSDEDDFSNMKMGSSNSNFQSSSSSSSHESPYKNRYASSEDDSEESDSSSEFGGSGNNSESGSSDGGESVSTYESGPSMGHGHHGYNNEPTKSYEEIQKEKQQILYELDRLQRQGFAPSKRYTMASTYEDMLYERNKLKKQRDVEKSVKFSRDALMMVVSGVEFLNGKFDPFDIRLNGWSEKVMENINDYDEIFEELHDKYGESVKTAPELRLMLTLAGSGFMFHLQNSLFKSVTPDLNDILRNNPDIMKNIQQAAAQNVQQNIRQQFGENDPIGNMMNQGISMKMNSPQLQPQQTRTPQRGNIPMGPSRPLSTGNSPQPTMRGPGGNGVDEILKELGGNSASPTSSRRDDDSMSESSFNMRTFGKSGGIKKSKKGGISLDFT